MSTIETLQEISADNNADLRLVIQATRFELEYSRITYQTLEALGQNSLEEYCHAMELERSLLAHLARLA